MNDAELRIRREDVIKEGWLMKQSRFLKDWRRRWVVLTPQYLCSFRHPDSFHGSPTEALALKNCTTVKSADDDLGSTRHVFRVDSANRVFFLAASSSTEKESWIGHIGRQMVRRSVIKDDSEDDDALFD